MARKATRPAGTKKAAAAKAPAKKAAAKAVAKAAKKPAAKSAAAKKPAASNRRDSDARRKQIEDVALKLIIKNGYRATSMLTVAREANASNETMYKWYGNKQALITAIVKRELDLVAGEIDATLNGASKPDAAIAAAGEVILKHVTGDRGVALLRAAGGDVHDTGEIGKAIANGERDMMVAKLAVPFEQVLPPRKRDKRNAKDAADTYLNLLIADMQVRRLIGARGSLSSKEMAQRAQQAAENAIRLAKS